MGVDLVKSYSLVINVKANKLIDQRNMLHINSIKCTDKATDMKHFDARNDFASIQEKIKNITVLGYKTKAR